MNKCLQCGQCCRHLIIDQVYEYDLIREPRLRAVVEPIRRTPGVDDDEPEQYFLKTPCPFLTGPGRCSIYPTRPTICVAHKPGEKHFCAAALYKLATKDTVT
jgi:Fe-S-cluster containining protein